MFARSTDGGVLIRPSVPLDVRVGDAVMAKAQRVEAPIEGTLPVLRLSSAVQVIAAPRPTVQTKLEWVVSLLEASPPVPGLVAVADPDSFDFDASCESDVEAHYHRLNGRLMAETLSPYWGTMEPVMGSAASPGVKHYGASRGIRVRRSILVPYDSRIAATCGFHGFSLTGTADIAPLRLLSGTGDRLLSAAHEAGHLLEPLVGIWPDQKHLSECFADAFAILAIRLRPEFLAVRADLLLYRDMRLAALLWGDSAHATGLAVARALAVRPRNIEPTVSATAALAFKIAFACAEESDALLRRRSEWLEAAREQSRLPRTHRTAAGQLEAYREFLKTGHGTADVRSDIVGALAAFDRIAVSGSACENNRRIERVFRADLAALLANGGEREQCLFALRRTRAALDRGLPSGMTHDRTSPKQTPLVCLRTRLLDEAVLTAERMPDKARGRTSSPPTMIMIDRAKHHARPIDIFSLDPKSVLDLFSELTTQEAKMLKDERRAAGSARTLAAAATGRLMRERIDFALAVTADPVLFHDVRNLNGPVADEMMRLAAAPVPLLVRHGDHPPPPSLK